MSAIIYELILFLAAFTTFTESKGNSQAHFPCAALFWLSFTSEIVVSIVSFRHNVVGAVLSRVCYVGHAHRGRFEPRHTDYLFGVWIELGERNSIFPLFGNAIVRCCADVAFVGEFSFHFLSVCLVILCAFNGLQLLCRCCCCCCYGCCWMLAEVWLLTQS